MFDKLRNVLKDFVKAVSTKKLNRRELQNIADEFLLELVSADVAFPVAEYLLESVTDSLLNERVERFSDPENIVKEKLKEKIINIFREAGEIDFINLIKRKILEKKPFVVLFLGPNGHGKTTTIAKIANLLKKEGLSVVIACSDTFRAGAIEQLEYHCERLGVKLIKHTYGADPAAVAYDAVEYAKKRDLDVVLIDTAGRLQTDKNLMDEMRKIVRVVNPDFKVFVGDALTGNDAFNQAAKFNEEIGIDGSVLTKVDTDVKGGTAISIVYATKKPIVFLGVGQDYNDIIPFDIEWIINRIFGDECETFSNVN